jgi:hypothetical protein
MLSLTHEGITAALRNAEMEDTEDNREHMFTMVCEELERGNCTEYGMEKAREQRRAQQRIRRNEKSLISKRDDGSEGLLREAERCAGVHYQEREHGTRKICGLPTDKNGVILNDTATEEFSALVQEVEPADRLLQQSALSDLSERDRAWLFEYETRDKAKGTRRTPVERNRASRLRKRVKNACVANKGLAVEGMTFRDK